MTNIEECELQDKNQTTGDVESSQVAHKNSAFQNEETIEQIVSEEEILTDISECVSVVSNCNDNIYDDNISIESSNVLLNLGKSSKNEVLDKSQAISESFEPKSVNGLSINIVFCKSYLSLKL